MSTPDAPARSDVAPERALRRLLRGVLGPSAADLAIDDDAADLDEAVRVAREARGLAPLGRRLTEGMPYDDAVVATVRDLITQRERQTARALAMGAAATGSPWLADLCIGLVQADRALFAPAWSRFRDIDAAVLARLAPVEAVGAALHAATAEATAVARAVASDPERHTTAVLVELAGRLLVFGHADLAGDLAAEAERRTEGGEVLCDDDHRSLVNLRRWTSPPAAAELDARAVRVGVIDYYQPDLSRSSRNVGDYVQTLSMLGHLGRFSDVTFSGEDGLGELATEIQARVRPELRTSGVGDRVHLSTVSRDYSEGDPIEPDTWMVAFGWHMHPMWRLRFGLPYHPHLNPLLLSFHVNHAAALTPEALDYLRAHGPVGCRDWTTVYLLLSAGVDAFFTGCITSTVGNVYPDRIPPEEGVVAAIDYPAGRLKAARPVESTTNVEDRYRYIDLVGGIRDAMGRLDDYQQRYHRIVTSRLHSYLPGTSLGIPVSFRPKQVGDVRFDGLLDMTPGSTEFQAMREGITALLGDVLSLVVAGAERDTVYARWRELTAPMVEQARARLAEPAPTPDPIDDAALVASVVDLRRDHGPTADPDATHVALACDANFAKHLPVTLESIVANASGPLHVWVCTRGWDAADQERLATAFPDTPLSFLPFDAVTYGEINRMIPYITISTMDRLLLPTLLPDVDRITYIDIDTVTAGDVCELARIDLGGHPFAARESYNLLDDMWRDAGDLLPADHAADLRRTMSARHRFGLRTLNAGVLVLDLDRLRADGFVPWCLDAVRRYGLNDQDVLQAWAGDDYERLPHRWNSLPIIESIDDFAIVHFAGIGKPWTAELTPYCELWRAHAARVDARMLATPTPA